MYGFYTISSTTHVSNNNNNNNNNKNSYCALETCSSLFVSSEILKCRLLKWLLDHPMNKVWTSGGILRPVRSIIHVRVLHYHFNNPRFKQSHNNNNNKNSYCALETCSSLFVSSEILKCRLLKWLLDHPMQTNKLFWVSCCRCAPLIISLKGGLNPPLSTL